MQIGADRCRGAGFGAGVVGGAGAEMQSELVNGGGKGVTQGARTTDTISRE